MTDFETAGAKVRGDATDLVLPYMSTAASCRPDGPGQTQASVFRACGPDWGPYPKATSSSQQYWVVALLKALEAEGRIQQVAASGPWRLAQTV
jgi:hypothetical protein